MRPETLFGLFAPMQSLPGIGPRLAKLLEKSCGAHVVDLIWRLPREVVDRRFRPKIVDAPDGKIATLAVTVDKHDAPSDRKRPYRITAHDETGFLTLVFFNADKRYLMRELPIGEARLVSGRVEYYRDQRQMAHPDFITPVDRPEAIPAIEPVYPLTAGLTPKVMTKAIRAALDRAPDLPEWQDPAFLKARGWPAWREALLQAHAPDGPAALEPAATARQRLAFDELLASQLALAIVRASAKRAPGQSIEGDGRLCESVLRALPFALTGSQTAALSEIRTDMAEPARMLRLLQGDVGSGKTVVALLTMLTAVEAGGQAALLAPTEILSRQHLETIAPLAEAAGVSVAMLTGRDKGKARADLLDRLGSGEIDILIGTHAIFQQSVDFKNLMVAVVDEQHRFGVHQRLALANKGRGVDLLVMTATPIPRTLMLSAYGDLDVSRLTDKPPGRKPIDTRLMGNDRLEEVIAGVGRAAQSGAQVYWVCPLVEESEALDLAAAEERAAHLTHRFCEDAVALVHGRMKAAEKDVAMARFAEGDAQILVATTVIEVGVDVPNATIMVIEHAERFGLAQLHQLRGRIGRGEKPSTCLLVYGGRLGQAAERRLRMMRETEDGFRIAEEDLRLRGAGELLGVRQSGLPVFKLADLAQHGDLLAAARDDARLILERDPALQSARGSALRVLLYLFERDAVVSTLRSG